MRIAFDSWVLSSRLRYQGTYVYARSLIAQFKKVATQRDNEFLLFTCPRAANDANSIEGAGGFEPLPSNWLRRDRIWRLAGASFAASRARADVMFSPTSSIFPWGSVPVVCTIHDVTPVVMPSHYAESPCCSGRCSRRRPGDPVGSSLSPNARETI